MKEIVSISHNQETLPLNIIVKDNVIESIAPQYLQFVGKTLDEFLPILAQTYNGTLICSRQIVETWL